MSRSIRHRHPDDDATARMSDAPLHTHDAQYPEQPGRQWLHEIIFEADTPAGRAFDLTLLVAIVLSVGIVLVESVRSVQMAYFRIFYLLEWTFTLLFTAEYLLRLYAVKKPLHYARSFYGVVDLLAILPTYLSLLVPGAQALSVVRILRLLRVFRILKLASYLKESGELWRAMVSSRRKITIFLMTVSTVVVVVGAIMHVVEGPESGFTDIPTSVYWAVVTLTTVGYGDISPATPLGRFLAVLVMLMGYGVIAVPTGIVTAELTRGVRDEVTNTSCPVCGAEGHRPDARFCRRCGGKLE